MFSLVSMDVETARHSKAIETRNTEFMCRRIKSGDVAPVGRICPDPLFAGQPKISGDATNEFGQLENQSFVNLSPSHLNGGKARTRVAYGRVTARQCI